MKKIILLLIAVQGVLMAAFVKEIEIKESKVPVVFEEREVSSYRVHSADL